MSGRPQPYERALAWWLHSSQRALAARGLRMHALECVWAALGRSYRVRFLDLTRPDCERKAMAATLRSGVGS